MDPARRLHPDDPARSARLCLASKSPRRRELLRRSGVRFDIIDAGIDDSLLVHTSVTPAQWVAALAYLKAWCGRRTLGEQTGGAVVLGSDTVVVKDGRIIGQPRDEADARRIIHTLESGAHEVLTGVALVESDARRVLFTDRATVRVGEIGAERVDQYLASGDWRGKAGAYNLEERLAAGWPIEYQGDPTSIMGLPMRRLEPLLLPRFAEADAAPEMAGA
ncbi:MAG: Maf family protein [Phycisphaerales bacterium]